MDTWKTASFEDVLRKLTAEIDTSRNLIISSEMLEKCAEGENQNFRRFLSLLGRRGYRIKVIYVIRRQDHFLDSQFKQDVKDPSVEYWGDPQDFIKAHAARLRYTNVASAWEGLSEVDNVAVVPYLEGQASETFSRILSHMGFPDLMPKENEIPRVNPSLDGNYLRLKHFLNRYELSSRLQKQIADHVMGRVSQQRDVVRLTLFEPSHRSAFLHQLEDDFLKMNAVYDLGESWFNREQPVRQLFTPMQIEEVSLAIDRIAEFDMSLAADIRDSVRRAPRKLPVNG